MSKRHSSIIQIYAPVTNERRDANFCCFVAEGTVGPSQLIDGVSEIEFGNSIAVLRIAEPKL